MYELLSLKISRGTTQWDQRKQQQELQNQRPIGYRWGVGTITPRDDEAEATKGHYSSFEIQKNYVTNILKFEFEVRRRKSEFAAYDTWKTCVTPIS